MMMCVWSEPLLVIPAIPVVNVWFYMHVGTRYTLLEAISQQQNKTEHLHNIDISDLAQSSLKLVEF